MHRAASFGALAFLVIDIVTEILAQRSHILDAFIPFLSPPDFYIGLGTIASDLILLIVMTSILRKRFTRMARPGAGGPFTTPLTLHSCSGSCTGCSADGTAKPYVNWGYRVRDRRY